MSNNESVRVIVRIRPFNTREFSESGLKKYLYTDLDQNTITLDSKPVAKTFKFDFIGDAEAGQDQVFQNVAQPIVLSCLSGYNGTIFSYGQTGAGKTYTIHGPGLENIKYDNVDYERRGLLPRSLEFMFNYIQREMQKHQELEYLVKCSFMEIYQEQVLDLLNMIESKSLQIREDIKNGVYVEGLVEEQVNSTENAYELLRRGARNRHTGSTPINLYSSRSHTIFTLNVQSKERRDQLLNVKFARFHIVDLAGSERQKLTESSGERLKEASMINKSLSALGKVINALVDINEGKSRFIHFRDSKLTFILKDSLRGNSKTCIIANISPGFFSFNETLSTLKFAQRAKLIKTKAVINEDVSGGIITLKQELARLKQELAKVKTQPCIKCNYNQVEQSDNQHFNFYPQVVNDRVAEMEELLSKEQVIRMNIETKRQEEVKSLQDQKKNLLETVSKFESKLTNDKMLIKIKEDQISRFKLNNVFKDQQTQEYISELKLEIEKLKENYESHPVASKLFYENKELRETVKGLEDEIQQKPNSLQQSLKDLSEYNRQLKEMLQKSLAEKLQIKQQVQELQKQKTSKQSFTKIDQATRQGQTPFSSNQSPIKQIPQISVQTASPVKTPQQSFACDSPSKQFQTPLKQSLPFQSPQRHHISEYEITQTDTNQSQILIQQLHKLQQENEVILIDRNKLVSQNKKLMQELQFSQNIQNKLNEQNQKCLETEDKLRAVNEELETLQDSYRYLESLCKDLRKQIKSQKTGMFDNSQQIGDLQVEAYKQDNQMRQQIEDQQLRNWIDQQEVQVKREDQQKKSNQSQLVLQNQSLSDQLAEQLSELNLQTRSLQQKLQEAEEEVCRVKQILAISEQELQKTKDENQFLSIELNKTSMKATELSIQLEMLQKEHSDCGKQLEKQFHLQTQEQQSRKQQINELKQFHDQELEILKKQSKLQIQELKSQIGFSIKMKIQELKKLFNQGELKKSVQQLQIQMKDSINDITQRIQVSGFQDLEKSEKPMKTSQRESAFFQIQNQLKME